MSFNVLTVVGARPQFIKAAPVSMALARAGLQEVMVHTGQHYDRVLSDVFFERLKLRAPDFQLGVGSGRHGAQTAHILEKIEEVMIRVAPDVALLYGDTNSTLAAALSAAKLQIPIAHVEAGLRDFDQRVPEEVNRVLTDHMSAVLFAPTERAVENLQREGLAERVVRTGDVMYDTALLFRSEVESLARSVPAKYGLSPKKYAFLTVHRAENTDAPENWSAIVRAVSRVAQEVAPVIWAYHPRTQRLVSALALENVTLVEALPYFEAQSLVMNARVVLTDSGGLQKEAAFYGVPCVTLRDHTPWEELVEAGVNTCAGTDGDRILAAAAAAVWPRHGLPEGVYGDGRSADKIAEYLSVMLHRRDSPGRGDRCEE